MDFDRKNFRLGFSSLLTADGSLTFGCPEYLAAWLTRVPGLAFHLLCEGSWQGELGGRCGLASSLGLEPQQGFHDNCSHSEAGGNELLNFMTHQGSCRDNTYSCGVYKIRSLWLPIVYEGMLITF